MMRAWPTADSPEPERRNDLKEIEEPIARKSKTELALPNRVIDLTLKIDPRWRKSNTDARPPAVVWGPATERLDPTRAN